MTTSTIHTEGSFPDRRAAAGRQTVAVITSAARRPCAQSRARRRAAFSLVEIIIGSSIGSFILAGVLASFLMLTKSGMSLQNYSASETEIRRAIEDFAQDVRMASAITWNSASSITLTVPNNYTSTSNQVTYAWDSSTSGATAQTFYRMPGTASSTLARTTYVRNVSNLAFARYNRLGNAAANETETKRIQITLTVRKASTGLVATTTTLVSASYTLRNKPAS